ncbi:MAG: hypothetical protein IKK29_06200 [Christensenellaceae bacterium]|nr:hypothetical protein [Christensenellaceae bacterium]
MRPRELEHYIEIPLSEYRKLVEELAETKVYLMQRHDDIVSLHFNLKEVKDKLSKLSEQYEKTAFELECYKKMHDKEEE